MDNKDIYDIAKHMKYILCCWFHLDYDEPGRIADAVINNMRAIIRRVEDKYGNIDVDYLKYEDGDYDSD